ncbi:hypothetical protein F511_23514 [Dorcoceras hygrometricum]|uniref:Uncharacterized protein n=1 Tax=Dorcoceras hygrometricum TaxID=472368 RepID=A0A2Z7DAB6_9LAMI|nr:hypothetical protein F511_23514 [Dorcoceras hygrometricum]
MLNENERLAEIISSWTRSSASLDKLHGAMKPSGDKSGLGYGSNDNSTSDTNCNRKLGRTKFRTMSFVKSSMGQSVEAQSDEIKRAAKPPIWHEYFAGWGILLFEKPRESWLKKRVEQIRGKPKSGGKRQSQFSRTSTKERHLVQIWTFGEERVKTVWGVSGSVFEGEVTEFFANAKVITDTIVSFVANRKMIVTEMRMRFSGIDVPFRAPNKRRKMKMEYRLLHDIVAKALCAKAVSFDVVTSEKFDLMVAISAGLNVNCAHVLFQILVAMVHTPTKQSQRFAVQLSVLLAKLVQADLGESVKLPLKVLNHKSVRTYVKKNLTVVPAGESSKNTEDTTSGTEVVKKPVEARSHAALAKSKFGTSSDVDSCPLAKLGALQKGGATPKHKLVVESSDSESTVSLPLAGFNPGPIPDIPAGTGDASTAGAPEDHMEKTPEMEGQADNASTAADQEEHVQFTEIAEAQGVYKEQSIVIRSDPDQSAQNPMTFTGKGIFPPVEIREINWVTHFLPKIDPAGKELLQHLDRPNPLEEHYLLVLQGIKDKVDSQIHLFNQLCRLSIGYRLNRVSQLLKIREIIRSRMVEHYLHPRLLRQAALEALTRSARTNTPRKTRPEQFPAKTAAAARGAAAAAA